MKSDMCVQSTNDFSTLSKVSAISMGYFNDQFQKYFVSRTCRRSPLIHRGYCVRAQAITHCLLEFLQDTASCPHRQVLSLGCGFDSLYFRTCGTAVGLGSTCIWEVDFPAVVQRKRLLIEQTEALKGLLKNLMPPGTSNGKEVDAIVLDSEDYRLIGVDLCDVVSLDSALEGAGFRWDCPTLILAEVVLCYMDPARSGDVIDWAGRRFLCSRFVLYEQFFPDDAFGRVMINHFESLNSALRSVGFFPRLQDQEQRFLQKELHLKCSHYFILVASRGDIADAPALRPHSGSTVLSVIPPPIYSGSVVARPQSPSVLGLRRFGHRSCLVSSRLIITTGGFGEGNGKHQRLRDVHLLVHEHDVWNTEATVSQWDGRLLHSLTLLRSGALLVLGGRFSPSRPAADALILSYDEETGAMTTTRYNLRPELRRWRHTATEVSLYGHSYVFVFGGRSLESAALQDVAFLHTEDMSWAQVPVVGTAPLGCHSHSSCARCGGAILSGGLLASGIPSGSITVLKTTQSHFSWEHLHTTPPLTPRYSHSSHVIGDKLLLVGGVWIHARAVPGLTVVDLITGHVAEILINSASLEWPLMLHGHSSVLLPDGKHVMVLGGGGTCFSFGTHLNVQPTVVELPCMVSSIM
ncbi:tRNA wybutosine-synthesizing protein 4 isoform X4 [Dendrobates tinctorius]|uniref:tRNA wybutosine-synthesizing protein 4 isoform X4 n=1 Tax=Dendrobates tinctorius TaxID=92724 RepID=UPI003CC93BAE